MSETIAVLGAGTVGRTLAAGWARAGHTVVLGSRRPGDLAVSDVSGAAGAPVTAALHADAARAADVVVVTVPGGQVPSLVEGLGDALAGRIVVDATNNVAPDAPSMNAIAALSAAGGVVFRGFNTVGWEQMAQPLFGRTACDLLYTGPDEGRDVVERIVADLGFRPVHLGDGPAAHDAVDALARLWFLLAFGRGYGRRLGFRLLTSEDDELS